MSKVILVTGASQGFGRNWAEVALQAGHRVVATARRLDSLSELADRYGDAVLTLQLDVTDRQRCFDVVAQAREHFGTIDVLLSNAGYGHFGMLEEISEDEARGQIETNVFGSVWIIQAVLPGMREQRSGHICQVSSIGGAMAFPNLSIYHASKWAMEGLCESLAQEVADFGIHVTIIEPGPFTTEWSQSSAVRSEPIADYDPVRAGFAAQAKTFDRGNPDATGAVIMELLAMPKPPLRLMLGRMAFKVIEPATEARLKEWREGLAMAEAAHE